VHRRVQTRTNDLIKSGPVDGEGDWWPFLGEARGFRHQIHWRLRKSISLFQSRQVLEPRRRQLGEAHGVLDVLVTQVGLQPAGVVAVIGQLKA
jgi:hypothetical protein